MEEGENKTGGEQKNRRSPEPEFFDELTEPQNAWFSVLDFLGKGWVRWTAVLVLPVALAAVVFRPRPRQARVRPDVRREEKREVITRAMIDRAIELSAKEKREAVPTPRQRVGGEKRKFDAGMAVYLPEKQIDLPSSARSLRPDREDLKLGLPSGTKVPALLSSRVFSFNVAAPVLALVAKDFAWQGRTVIPKDSRFFGEAGVLKSIDRINVTFDLLIFPDGREIRVRAMALSEDGSSGVKGKIEKHGDVKVLKAIGETLLAGSSLFVGGGRRNPYSLEDQLRMNLAQNLTDQAGQDLRSIRVDKSVTVEAYTPIQVILLEPV